MNHPSDEVAANGPTSLTDRVKELRLSGKMDEGRGKTGGTMGEQQGKFRHGLARSGNSSESLAASRKPARDRSFDDQVGRGLATSVSQAGGIGTVGAGKRITVLCGLMTIVAPLDMRSMPRLER